MCTSVRDSNHRSHKGVIKEWNLSEGAFLTLDSSVGYGMTFSITPNFSWVSWVAARRSEPCQFC